MSGIVVESPPHTVALVLGARRVIISKAEAMALIKVLTDYALRIDREVIDHWTSGNEGHRVQTFTTTDDYGHDEACVQVGGITRPVTRNEALFLAQLIGLAL